MKETISALTYGNIVKLTREAIINDDMDMFDQLAVQLGSDPLETQQSPAVGSPHGCGHGFGVHVVPSP